MALKPIKTPENKNIYFQQLEDGEIPSSPKPKAIRWTEESIQGTQSTIESNTKLPNRDPQEPLNGTESSSGNFTQEFAPDDSDEFLSAVLCTDWEENIQEARLVITSGATSEGEVSITVGSAMASVSLTSSDNTPALVAKKIAEQTFTQYEVSVNTYNENEVIFKASSVEATKTTSIDFGETGAAGELSKVCKVKTLTRGADTKKFYMLREYTQDPKKYQLFNDLQFNQLTMSCKVSAIPTMSYDLMGTNNPRLEDSSPVSLDSKVKASTTTPFTTLNGFLTVGGKQNRDATNFELVINNNSTSVYSLFEKEARESALGKLDITGTLTEFFVEGESYNKAIEGEKTPLQICFTGKDEEGNNVKYLFELMVKFTSPTEDMADQITHSLPFQTFGDGRIKISKIVEEAA